MDKKLIGKDLYVLEKDMPGMAAGSIFEYRDYEEKGDIGSPLGGYLCNSWVNGNCQSSWAGRTHILPGQLRQDKEWFSRVKMLGNSSHIFAVNNVRFKRVNK